MSEPSLAERIHRDLIAAMKAREQAKVSALRLLKSALENKKIELRAALTPEQEISVLKTMAKQRGEAIEVYDEAGRTELADKERAELRLIESYLPEAVSEEEIESAARGAIADLGAEGPKDMGRVMKETLGRLAGTGKTVDGKAVNGIVRRLLA